MLTARKPLLFLMILLLMVTINSGSVRAQENKSTDQLLWGNNLYSVDEHGSATIDFWGEDENVIEIPAYIEHHPVKAIGAHAFYRCTSLTSISLPESLIFINDYAFSDCKYLTSILLPDSLVSIGDRAFHSCDSLTSISLPDSLVSVGQAAFAGCEALTQFNVSSNNEVYAQIDGVLFDKTIKSLHTLSLRPHRAFLFHSCEHYQHREYGI